jgi:hypothetical protein
MMQGSFGGSSVRLEKARYSNAIYHGKWFERLVAKARLFGRPEKFTRHA